MPSTFQYSYPAHTCSDARHLFCSLLGFEDLDVVNPDGSRAEEAHVDANDVSLLCPLTLNYCTIQEHEAAPLARVLMHTYDSQQTFLRLLSAEKGGGIHQLQGVHRHGPDIAGDAACVDYGELHYSAEVSTDHGVH